MMWFGFGTSLSGWRYSEGVKGSKWTPFPSLNVSWSGVTAFIIGVSLERHGRIDVSQIIACCFLQRTSCSLSH
jgi:hypothetical protein